MLASRIGFTAFLWRMATYSIIKMSDEARTEEDDEFTLKNICIALCSVDANLFSKIFVETDAQQNIPKELIDRASEIYQEKYPAFSNTKSFEELYRDWQKYQAKMKCRYANDLEDRSSECGKRAFNPMTNKYSAVFINPAKKKKTNSEFETLKFLLQVKSRDEAIPLRWETDMGDYINNLYFDEDREKKYLLADQSLRKIAKIVHVLNENSYRIMDLHPERMIK